ncbi:MAG: 4Fe-4S dicluster-binding protein, partial [Polyangiaceae bacterium]
ARIDQDLCIHCNKCYIACEDAAHQCIDRIARNGTIDCVVDESHCVGCNLCMMVCPVENCITMARVDDGKSKRTWHDVETPAAH